MKYVIFDLDGCLADDRRRKPLVDLGATDGWEAYHAECHKDPLINSHLLDLTASCLPIILTSRPEKFRAQTVDWLREIAKIDPFAVLMRPNECLMGSAELKEDFLKYLIKIGISPRDIHCAFDDREDVLAAYMRYGIPTVKVSYPSEENSIAQKTDTGLLAAEKLETMAQTFRDRNKVYGSNYKMVGKLMRVLFPDGVPQELVFEDHFHLFELLLVKISRYAVSNLTHTDSIHDAAVYAAMCEAINDQKKEK